MRDKPVLSYQLIYHKFSKIKKFILGYTVCSFLSLSPFYCSQRQTQPVIVPANLDICNFCGFTLATLSSGVLHCGISPYIFQLQFELVLTLFFCESLLILFLQLLFSQSFFLDVFHCVKSGNFTKLHSVEILCKGTVSAQFRAIRFLLCNSMYILKMYSIKYIWR